MCCSSCFLKDLFFTAAPWHPIYVALSCRAFWVHSFGVECWSTAWTWGREMWRASSSIPFQTQRKEQAEKFWKDLPKKRATAGKVSLMCGHGSDSLETQAQGLPECIGCWLAQTTSSRSSSTWLDRFDMPSLPEGYTFQTSNWRLWDGEAQVQWIWLSSLHQSTSHTSSLRGCKRFKPYISSNPICSLVLALESNSQCYHSSHLAHQPQGHWGHGQAHDATSKSMGGREREAHCLRQRQNLDGHRGRRGDFHNYRLQGLCRGCCKACGLGAVVWHHPARLSTDTAPQEIVPYYVCYKISWSRRH